MSQAFFIAILLTEASSLAVQVQPTRRPLDSNERRICRVSEQIGTRLGRVVRCRTEAEWAESGRDNVQIVDRMQRVAPPCQPWSRC